MKTVLLGVFQLSVSHMRASTFLLSLAFMLPTAALATEPAPPLSLPNDKGTIIEFPRSHEGVDVYLFWATWCPYCKAFMPHLQSMLDEYGDEVTVFALQIRDDEDGRAFLDDNGFDFELLPNADSAMPAYGARSTPGLFLVDGDGNIRFNLYEIVLENPPGYEDLSNRAKAARRGPAWAARVRQEIDRILAE